MMNVYIAELKFPILHSLSSSSSLFLLKPVCLLPTIHCVHNKQPVSKVERRKRENVVEKLGQNDWFHEMRTYSLFYA